MQIGTEDEIAPVESVEVERVFEAEERKKRSKDRAEADPRARTPREQ